MKNDNENSSRSIISSVNVNGVWTIWVCLYSFLIALLSDLLLSSDFESERLKRLNDEMDDCIGSSSWSEAYLRGMETLNLYDKVYGEYHTDKTLQLFRLMKLRICMSESMDNDAIQLINKTRHHIMITHGQNHGLYDLYRELVE